MCLCEYICGTLGIGDSLNKQKADNLSDVPPWPRFIFREGIFLQLLIKVASLSHETVHVSSQHFSCSEAQIRVCVWTTNYNVRPWLWHNHLRSYSGRGEIISLFFALAKMLFYMTEKLGWDFSPTYYFLFFSFQLIPVRWTNHSANSRLRAQRTQICWKKPSYELYSVVMLHPCFKTSNPLNTDYSQWLLTKVPSG